MQFKNREDEHGIGVTGLSGFIGSHLNVFLREKGINIIPFRGNLFKINDLKKYFSSNKIDYVIHLAGSFDSSFDNLIDKNLKTTQNLIKVGLDYGLKKIIYTSSAAVYGNSPKGGSVESDLLLPNTLYGLTKKYAEECIDYYTRNNNLSYVIFRLPNIYGEGSNKGVIYNFLHDIKTKGSITVEGDGSQKRNFLHVSDVCEVLYKAIDYDENNIFNVGYYKSLSLNDVINIFKKYYSFKINYISSRDNYSDMIINLKKINKIFNLNTKKNLEFFIKNLNI